MKKLYNYSSHNNTAFVPSECAYLRIPIQAGMFSETTSYSGCHSISEIVMAAFNENIQEFDKLNFYKIWAFLG